MFCVRSCSVWVLWFRLIPLYGVHGANTSHGQFTEIPGFNMARLGFGMDCFSDTPCSILIALFFFPLADFGHLNQNSNSAL